jgi:hypothetical protein
MQAEEQRAPVEQSRRGAQSVDSGLCLERLAP